MGVSEPEVPETMSVSSDEFSGTFDPTHTHARMTITINLRNIQGNEGENIYTQLRYKNNAQVQRLKLHKLQKNIINKFKKKKRKKDKQI